MVSVSRKMGMLVLICLVFFASVSAASDKSKDESQKKTYIQLTKEEAQLFEEINGGKANDESIAGGTIAYNGVLTEEQIIEYKSKLLNPKKEVSPQDKKDVGKDVQALWCTGDYLSNVQNAGNTHYFPSQRLGSAEGWAPVTLSVVVNTSVTATVSTSISVSNAVVEAGVGYSLSASYGVSSSGSWPVPSGKYGRLEAYAMHDKKTWDVWDDDCGTPEDTYRGSGSSYKPNGSVYFKQVIVM